MNEWKKRELAETKEPREFYKRAARTCEICSQDAAHDVHEICGGHLRHLSVYQPNNWLALCRDCHTNIAGMSYEDQLHKKFEAVLKSFSYITGRQLEIEDII